MRKIGITMLEDFKSDRNEYRSSIDSRLIRFLFEVGLEPVLLANEKSVVNHQLRNTNFSGFIFSGGGSCSAISTKVTPRDEVELLLLKWSIANDLPCIGICRGMQFIVSYFGGELKSVSDHVTTSHLLLESQRIVNSFHEYGIVNAPGFQVLDRTSDDVVEYVSHKSRKIYGIMWHPERNAEFDRKDIEIFQKIFEVSQ